jgi:chromosomal replication initiator protein
MTEQDRQIWAGVLAYLRRHYPTLCRAWFEQLQPLLVDGGALHLRAESDVHRDYLRRSCAEPFNDAARTVSGRLLAVRFLGPHDSTPTRTAAGKAKSLLEPKPAEPEVAVDASAEPHRAAGDAPSSLNGSVHTHPTKNAPGGSAVGTSTPLHTPDPVVQPAASGHAVGMVPALVPPVSPGASRLIIEPARPGLRRDDALVINPDYNFDNFVVGSGNRLAHAAAVAVGGHPGKAYNPFFVHGGVGLGKTHLLQAICLQMKKANPAAVLYYISCESFVTQFIDAVRTGEMSDFRHRYRDVDCLIIDDIHFLAKADRTQEEFFHTFNSLYQAGKQIVLSSDAPPEEIPQLEDRLVSRFKWGLVAKINPPDFETRVAILKNKAVVRGFELPDDVATYIANRLSNNIRELEGAIGKLQIQAAVDNRPIDMDLATTALGDITPRTITEPSIQQIIDVVTDYFRVRLIDLQSERRSRSVNVPRQVCMYLIRQMTTRHSLEQIGGYFGNRDHTTVMHSIRNVDQRRQTEPDFDAQVRACEVLIERSLA